MYHATAASQPTNTGLKLVIIIPALNEAASINRVINSIPDNVPAIAIREVVVVDDGSTDGTAQLAHLAGASVVSHRQTLGVGAAFHTGIKEALQRGADIIVNIDADGQFDPGHIPQLIEPIIAGRAEFATATRFAQPELMPAMPKLKLWGNHWMVSIINFITKKRFTDVSCGFRAYSREAALRLTLFGRFTYTQETLIDLAFKGITITEVPLRVRGEREHGTSRVADNLWRYGLKAAAIIFRAALDYRPQYFFGIPGFIIFVGGVGAGLFLLQHFLASGQTYPYRSLVQLSGVLIIVGFLMLVLSLLADMLQRNRLITEEAVYHARKAVYASQSMPDTSDISREHAHSVYHPRL